MPDTNFGELIDKVVATTNDLAWARARLDDWLPSPAETLLEKETDAQQKAVNDLMEAIDKLGKERDEFERDSGMRSAEWVCDL